MTNQELSVLKNTIEQMASDAEDRGERDFCIRLTVDDAFALCKLKPVSPAVHGRWDDSGRYAFQGGGTAVRCTNCGCALTVSEYRLNNWNYCPVCGSKMDGEDAD